MSHWERPPAPAPAPAPAPIPPSLAEPSGYTKNSDNVLAAIQAFVGTVPLNRKLFIDTRTSLNLSSLYGHAVLPLWRHVAPLDPANKHWYAFNTFLDTIWDHILHCNELFKAEHPRVWAYAMMKQEREIAEAVILPPARPPYLAKNDPYVIEAANYGQSVMQNGTRGGHCFETLRLTANMVTDVRRLRTVHPSEWAVLSAFGDWKYGEAMMHHEEGERRLRFQEGQVYVVQTEQRFEFRKYFGPTRFLLELFLPDLAELVSDRQLGAPVEVGASRVKIEEEESVMEDELRKQGNEQQGAK